MSSLTVDCMDNHCRLLGACELPDDDHFCLLESLLVQLGVKEVALPRLITGKDTGAAQAEGSDRDPYWHLAV